MPTHKIYSKYASVGNDVLQSNTLSLKAKGLLGYLVSKPEGWDFSTRRISEEIKESRPTIISIIQELEEFNLVRREKQTTGRVIYHIYTSFELVKKHDQAMVKEFHRGKSLPLSNKEVKVKKSYLISKDIKEVKSPKSDSYGNFYVNELIRVFTKYKHHEPIDTQARREAWSLAVSMKSWIKKQMPEGVELSEEQMQSKFTEATEKYFAWSAKQSWFEPVKRMSAMRENFKLINNK